MRKVAVTGGSGFIGSWVVDNLLSKGYDVIVFDTHKDTKYPDGVEVMLGDMRDNPSIRELVAKSEGLVHLSGLLGTQEHVFNPRPIAETNILGGINVMEAAAEYGIPVVNIAVGNFDHNNPYSISKHTIERFIDMYNRERGTAINILRGVNCFGPRQVAAAPFGPSKVRKIVPAFVCRALSGMPIEVYGDGEQVSDCVWVGDMAEALVRALEKAADGIVFDKAIECGPAQHTTVNQIAETVRDLVSPITGQEVEIVHLPMRPGEKSGAKVSADTSTLKLIDMDPADLLPLRDGMERTVKYFNDSEGITWNKP